MIARGFRPVGWVAAVGTAALGCYMLSLQVASERAELANLEQRIVSTRQQIRTLQTELGTRGRLQQLEQWNAEVLALSAPVADQFLDSGMTLARFDTRAPRFEDHDQVRMASAETPAQARPPVPVLAAAPAAPQPTAASSMVRRASLAVTADAAPAPRTLASASAEPARARPAAAQAGTPSLLDEGVLRDLGAAARAERGGGARN